jgi:circadian clock protein KaiC
LVLKRPSRVARGTVALPERAPTGIPGFDTLTAGGIPRERTTLLIGGPGCGKTIFALQALVEGARCWGEPGIFVAFEERAQQIKVNVASFGWDLGALQRRKLFFLDAHLSSTSVQSGPFDLTGLLAGLSAKVRALGARRIVFDGVDVLLSQLEDTTAERREMRRLYEWLTDSGLTGMLTAKTDGPDPSLAPRYGFLQYLADCVIGLNHRLSNGIAVRHLRILKYRGSAASSNEIPMILSSTGMQVIAFADDSLEHPVSTEKVTSGVERLDAMLGGGYFRGTCVLVSGAPGTAKSTLAGVFADAACRRGERVLFVSFDESGNQVVRNFKSIGLKLERHVRSGLLRMHSVRSSARSSDEKLFIVRGIVEKCHARILIVDPLSALPSAIGIAEAHGSIERLIAFAKKERITLLATSLLDSPDPSRESTALNVSTIADTWIHLSNVIQGGERNRALTIVKSRGMGHSNQVRELLLGDRGVTLTDVYTSRGAVIMGTLRREKEERDRMDRLRERREAGAHLSGLEASITEASAHLSARKVELDRKIQELAELRAERSTDLATDSVRLVARRKMRGADSIPGRDGNSRRGRARRA